MLTTGKCPYCNEHLPHVEVEIIPIHETSQKKWKGASLVCPLCRKVLNVSFDPIAVKEKTVNQLREILNK